ncbi:MAG: NAD(P)-dependent oxidoreductase [Magnetococcales bacterium]|nr:NAD(P)-dependent oxidoreductase [Magnetococcales bacterium]MBF0321490.1 NAD(P)-dependent oxidoreductase [Magnetococcales bacterium]
MIDLVGRRIVLIGGAGFIGHNLALRLKKLGAEVSIIDSLQVNNLLAFSCSSNELPNRDLYLTILNERLSLLRKANVPLLIQDARDYHALSRLITQLNPQVIIHMAAVSHANRSNKDPYSTFDHSLRTLENALDCHRDVVEHFIYFSSSMVYGHFKADQVTEDTHCEPLGIYGALKFAGEKLVIAYSQTFGLPYTIIRPSALYGQRCVSRRVGQIFIENALSGTEVIISGDGSDYLDFTYIDDLIEGVVKVIQNKNSRREIFNLTFGGARSLADMAAILRVHFPEVKITYVPKDKLTPDRGTLSVEKAKNLIGYVPGFPLEEAFPVYIKWYRDIFAQTDPKGERLGFVV